MAAKKVLVYIYNKNGREKRETRKSSPIFPDKFMQIGNKNCILLESSSSSSSMHSRGSRSMAKKTRINAREMCENAEKNQISHKNFHNGFYFSGGCHFRNDKII
jgi:hypothetical protein